MNLQVSLWLDIYALLAPRQTARRHRRSAKHCNRRRLSADAPSPARHIGGRCMCCTESSLRNANASGQLRSTVKECKYGLWCTVRHFTLCSTPNSPHCDSHLCKFSAPDAAFDDAELGIVIYIMTWHCST